MGDERRERRAEPRLVGIAQRHESAAAALDEQRGLAAEQDDLRPRDPRGAALRALRPRQRCAVGLRGIGGGEDERLRLLPVPRAQLAQPLDRPGQRELRAAEPLDEVAAAADAERLERAQLAVDGAVAAGDALAADAVARYDPLALEQQLGQRAAVGAARRRGAAVGDQRPCVAVIAAARLREKRRGRSEGRGAS